MSTAKVVVCPQWASNWDVEGSNGNRYFVQFHRAEPPSCSCAAYKFSGEYGEQHCKHIAKVHKHGCFYVPNVGETGANDWADADAIIAGDRVINTISRHGLRLLSTAADTTKERCIGCGAPGIIMRVEI